jgi:CheY-like chemotaxis protein
MESDAPNRKKILVVEDDELTAKLMRQILEAEGHEVLVCETPFYAISALVRFRPDMIVMDILLSSAGVDGIDVYEIIKNDFGRETKKLPMIIVSGQRDDQIKQRALKAGAKSYLEKPFEPEELLATVSNVA